MEINGESMCMPYPYCTLTLCVHLYFLTFCLPLSILFSSLFHSSLSLSLPSLSLSFSLSQDIPWIIKPLPQKSLRQLFDNLMSSIATMFGSLKVLILHPSSPFLHLSYFYFVQHVVGSQVQATYTYGLTTYVTKLE